MSANDLAALDLYPRRGRRQRAAALQARMLKHSGIYNAAAVLRDSWHGSEARRQRCARALADVVLLELERAGDVEAALYATADALTCGALGAPWEA
jgi:hypothetical protein